MVIVKGYNDIDMSIVSKIVDTQSQNIKFQNISFYCETIEDANGTIFHKQPDSPWIPCSERLPAVQVVRCKDCKHRPSGTGCNHDLIFPDYVCPCQNTDDNWYSWMPDDEWYCAEGERSEP